MNVKRDIAIPQNVARKHLWLFPWHGTGGTNDPSRDQMTGFLWPERIRGGAHLICVDTTASHHLIAMVFKAQQPTMICGNPFWTALPPVQRNAAMIVIPR